MTLILFSSCFTRAEVLGGSLFTMCQFLRVFIVRVLGALQQVAWVRSSS